MSAFAIAIAGGLTTMISGGFTFLFWVYRKEAKKASGLEADKAELIRQNGVLSAQLENLTDRTGGDTGDKLQSGKF